MSANPLLKRLLDAGLQFTEMSREQADKLVKEFVRSGQAKRKDRELLVEQLLERGRSVSEGLAAVIQRELGKHLAAVVARLDDVEDRVEELAGRLGASTSRKAAAAATPPASTATKSTAKTSTAKKTTSTKAASKKSAAKKSTAKKSAAKKSPAKKSVAKKSAPASSGARGAEQA